MNVFGQVQGIGQTWLEGKQQQINKLAEQQWHLAQLILHDTFFDYGILHDSMFTQRPFYFAQIQV